MGAKAKGELAGETGKYWGRGDGKRGREDVGRTGEVNEQECGEADATQVWLWQRRVLYVNGFDVCKNESKIVKGQCSFSALRIRNIRSL